MTSKIHRYYWREIYQIAVQKFSSWSTVNGYNDWLAALVTNEKQFKLFTKEAVAEIKKLHQESPKYIYDDISDNDVCEKYNFQIVNYSPEYFPNEDGRTRVNYKGNSLGVEDYVLAKHKEIGFDGIKCESSPFHVIFGSLMYPILNDSDDPLMQVMETGDRFDFDAGLKPRQLRFWWPRDFGDKGYYLRRKKEIKAPYQRTSTGC